ncbi:MAG: sugar phosphate isomerase/epimerase [Clostridia bacterium]|nr:sugar phosphate isomerase/epimerase [Clostridia bacterium]
MYTSTSIEFVTARKMTHNEGIKLVKDAGFTAYDMSFTDMLFSDHSRFDDDDYLEYAKSVREYADSIGIVCNQAHAPFHSSTGQAEKDAVIYKKIVRSIECAAILGAKNIVVHPKQHLRYLGHEQVLKELNLEFYSELAKVAEKCGICVAAENMWQTENNRIWHSTCSKPSEFCEYIDMVNHKNIVACLDIGHVSLVDEDIPDFIRALGKDRLKCLHVHDTNLVEDSHTLPFYGKIDYNAVCEALKEIGYCGDITLEANSFINKLPLSILPSGLKVMAEVADYIRQKVEG